MGTAGLIKPVSGEMGSRKRDGTYTQFSFPENLGNHAIVLNFSSYDFSTIGSQVSQTLSTSIALPIPNNLQDTFNLRIAPTELGSVGNSVRDIVSASGEGSLTAGGVIESAAAAVSGQGARRAAAAFDSVGGSNTARAIEVASGTIVNPRVALAFDGIDLKTHSFTWTLAPQSSRESDKLRDIIQKIKRSALPSYNNTFGQKVFLNYPNVVDIFFLGTTEGFMYYFKRAMISQFEVNYAGAGMPVFVEEGKPAVVTLTMNLTEIDIHTSEDYGGASSGSMSENMKSFGYTNGTGGL
jgi:hypothetical protein